MKNSLLTTILSWVLGTSLVLSIWFSFQFYAKTRELRIIQAQMSQYQLTRAQVNALLSDTMEYSRRDQGVIPILETIGLKQTKGAAGAAATNKPAGK